MLEPFNKKVFIINQKPIPQARPRVTKWGAYDLNRDQKNWIKLQLSEQMHEVISAPVEIEMRFFMPIPKSYSKLAKKLIATKLYPHVKKPDIDNLAILLLNCMNEIVYKDDSQVYKLTAYKEYSDDPRSEIVVKWAKSLLDSDSQSGQQ